jgi:two-component system NtrC family response regulator
MAALVADIEDLNLIQDLNLAAQSDLPVLVTSSRKDDRVRCARSIHEASVRCRGPFVAIGWEVSGAALEPSAGTAGSATDMTLQLSLEQACRGTLFVDEVGRLNPQTQALLLAFLERQVPGEPDLKGLPGVDGVRIITGAGDSLLDHVAAGSFDENLFYRLNVIRVDLTGEAKTDRR